MDDLNKLKRDVDKFYQASDPDTSLYQFNLAQAQVQLAQGHIADLEYWRNRYDNTHKIVSKQIQQMIINGTSITDPTKYEELNNERDSSPDEHTRGFFRSASL